MNLTRGADIKMLYKHPCGHVFSHLYSKPQFDAIKEQVAFAIKRAGTKLGVDS